MRKHGVSALAMGAAMLWSALAAQAVSAQDGYARSSTGVRELTLGSGTVIKMLLDASNLGSDEIEVGEITFPADYKKSPPHRHGQVELFYVIEGSLGHTVNGTLHVIEPGMIGIVRNIAVAAIEVIDAVGAVETIDAIDTIRAEVVDHVAAEVEETEQRQGELHRQDRAANGDARDKERGHCEVPRG